MDPTTETLLHHAARLARDVDHPPARDAAVHAVAVAACRHGDDARARALSEALSGPAHRAHLHTRLAWDALRENTISQANLDADAARDALAAPGRWLPVDATWVSPDDARCAVALLLVELARDPEASTLSRRIPAESPAKVPTVAALARHLRAEDAWEMVAHALRAVPQPDARARAVVRLFSGPGPRPRLVPNAESALVLIDAVVDGPGPTKDSRHIAGIRAAATLVGVFAKAPALTAAVAAFDRGVALADGVTGELGPLTDALSHLARTWHQHVSRSGNPAAALRIALDRVAATPLPPHPPQPGPWGRLLQDALELDGFALPLARVIARQPAVAATWAHALARLHLASDRPDRAAKVAAVLEGSAASHTADHESAALGAIVRAWLGDEDRALPPLLTLPQQEAEAATWLAGTPAPAPWALHGVHALLEGGLVAAATTVARLTERPDLRARLLATCATRMPAGEGAAAVATEALSAVEEAAANALPVPIDATWARLPRVFEDAGLIEDAEAAAHRILEHVADTPAVVWCAAAACLAPHWTTPRTQAALQAAWQHRIAAASGEDALELLIERLQPPPSSEGSA